MLSPKKTVEALEAKRELWRQAYQLAGEQAVLVRRALAEFRALSATDILERISTNSWPGARPTAEHDLYRDQVVPFSHTFASHEQARAWAAQSLLGQPTFAADGSQITPLSEYPLLVAAAQVAWYLNYHEPGGRHEKDLAIEVFIGDELGNSDETGATHVQTRRFQMEVEAIISFMLRSETMVPHPVCFLDGPLVVSFASPYAAHRRSIYVTAISRLLEAAEALRIPVIGYIADSSASDLLHLLYAVGLLPAKPTATDIGALHKLITAWGERSVTYICARDDGVLSTYSRHDGSPLSDQIAFLYLRTTGNGPLARLELPRWLAEDQAELERVLNVVRAECVIGLGYPYAIEAADQTAVLDSKDRERFKQIVAGFAANLELNLRVTPKARSKQRRRLGV